MRTLLIFGLVFILFMLAFVACDDEDDHGESGELGRGRFYYQCVNRTYDVACHGQEQPEAFPKAIAIQGHFDMAYVSNSDKDDSSLWVIGGSPNHVFQEGGALSIHEQVDVALLAMTTKSRAMDIMHVFAREVATVDLVTTPYVGPDDWERIEDVEIEIGNSLSLRGVAKDDLGRPLAGVLAYRWTIQDPSIAELGSDTTHSVVKIEALKRGQTIITVEVNAISMQYDLVVTDINTDLDGGTDTDTQSDTDSETESTDEMDSGTEEDAGTVGDSGTGPDSGTNG